MLGAGFVCEITHPDAFSAIPSAFATPFTSVACVSARCVRGQKISSGSPSSRGSPGGPGHYPRRSSSGSAPPEMPRTQTPSSSPHSGCSPSDSCKKTPRHSPHSHRCSCRKTPRRSANSRRECRCCTSSLKPLHTAPYSSTQLHASSSGSCKKAPRHSPRSYRYAGKKASSCSNSELTEMPRTQTLSISPHSRRARGCCTSSPRPPRYLQQSDAHRPCCSCCRNDLCSVPDPPFLWCILVLVLPWMHHECAQECHRAANYRSP